MVRYAAFSKRLARTQGHGKPACARKPHPDASSKPQSRHRRQRLEEGKGSLFIDKDEKQPKQFAGDASGRGDDCRQEGVAHAWSSVTLPIFMMIQPSPLPAERARSMSGWHRVRFFFGGYHCYQRCHGSREPLRWRWRPHESHSGPIGRHTSPPHSADPERAGFGGHSWWWRYSQPRGRGTRRKPGCGRGPGFRWPGNDSKC